MVGNIVLVVMKEKVFERLGEAFSLHKRTAAGREKAIAEIGSSDLAVPGC